jgi:hypothetical protein
MAVKIIRFSEPVNASEVVAQTRCKVALESLSDSAPWIVFAGLASSSSPLHQSDDLDLVPIGPRGVFLIETKHWDAAWINDNRASAEAEAEKLTAKAKRLSGRVKRAFTDSPKVTQAFLITREPAGPNLPPTIRGVPVWTLRDLAKIFRELPKGVLNESQVKLLTGTLEPAAKVQLDGKIRRIASYQNLELQTPNEQAFHRIYKGAISGPRSASSSISTICPPARKRIPNARLNASRALCKCSRPRALFRACATRFANCPGSPASCFISR